VCVGVCVCVCVCVFVCVCVCVCQPTATERNVRWYLHGLVSARRLRGYICHTHEWVMSHMNEALQSCRSHTRLCRCVWHDSSICERWLVHVCDMNVSCVWFEWSMACSMSLVCMRDRQCRMSKESTRGEWDWGVKNKNTHNTQINLNKQKLGEP